ncbi:MAG TPA: protein-disulfide reductase DsbD domain-containing protein [Stellaceae bacterium]|nr:protein-disulfide reductase DsbD domain-containing protein [Stellaceae bacterium]
MVIGRIGGGGLAAALALALLCLGSAAHADAGASDWFVTDQGRVRLVAATPSVGEGATVSLGLEFRLAPHWKIYWRSPGDAGYPPRLDWAGSTNLAGADIAWPAPQRFSVLGFETAGYTDAVVLPISARLQHPGAAAHLALAVDYLTCEKICIPYQAALTLDLPAGVAPSGAGGHAALIARYAARVPDDGKSAGLALAAATIRPGRRPVLELRIKAAPPLASPDAFVEGPAGVVFGAPRPAGQDGTGDAILNLPIFGAPTALERLSAERLTVTLVDGDRAFEATTTPATGPPARDLGLLLSILPVALLGGFILNFMPCVLPVLSIKLLSVIEQGGRSRGALRLGFLASAAGVILSFLALAGIVAALKTAGIAVGWGVQFQQPLFLVGMVVLLTLFACNLWGVFEVPLPQWLAGLGNAGQGHALLGNFAAGAFATLLATPCSAPFLGTAIGFALAAGPPEIFAVFATLGVGLAAPYLLVAAVPRLARGLPRPGHWMLQLRRVLGLALAATAAWLIYVLVMQIGAAAALSVAALMIAAAAALSLLRTPRARLLAPGALLAAAFLAPELLAVPPPIAASDGLWRPFDRAAIDRQVAEGRVVFVDVTADWCLTCKVNERLVLDAPAVHERLAAPGVVAMRADWTRPDEVIAAFLRGFGRYGIPFYAVYGPRARSGLPLPEIVTAEQVVAALGAAADPGGRVAGTAR